MKYIQGWRAVKKDFSIREGAVGSFIAWTFPKKSDGSFSGKASFCVTAEYEPWHREKIKKGPWTTGPFVRMARFTSSSFSQACGSYGRACREPACIEGITG
jgi:hypothetical protein